MTKNKEQLEEVKETTPEDNVSEETSETVEDSTINEEPKEDVVEEQIQKVDNLDENGEQLSLEIRETKEELAVIKEVRDELVKLYSDYKQVEQLKSAAEAENEKLKVEVEKLAAELHDYKVAEEKLQAEKKLQRLEQLSAKFTSLGQSKTVEYLESKDEETLSEFEKIVDAALSKVGDVAEMPSVTANTQTEKLSAEVKSKEEKLKENIAHEKPKEQLSDKDFFANICNTLTGQQQGAEGKKVKLM